MRDSALSPDFSAYGVPSEMRRDAAERELNVTGTTCPIVGRALQDAAAYTHRSDTVVVVGGGGAAGAVLSAEAGAGAASSERPDAVPEVAGEVSFVPNPSVLTRHVLPVV